MEVDNLANIPTAEMSSCEKGLDSLPTEIFQLILKDIVDSPENRSLKSCALVCSQWNVLCRIYLFQHIKIVNGGFLNDLKATLQSKPVIRSYIHELTIQSTPQGQVPEPSEWFASVPLAVASYLPKVHTIEFVGLWELGDGLTADFFQELATFAPVTKLVVRNSFVALRMLQAFASALPALQELQIGETYPLPAVHPNAPPNLYSPSLSSLHLHLGLRYPEAVDEGLTWALGTRSRATLRSLSLLVYFPEAAATTEHLTTLGDQLRHLDLHLGISTGSPFEHEMTKDELHINACTGLESLTLNCTAAPACSCMVMLLTEVSSPHIQQISIAISGNDVASLPDCRALAEPLSGYNLRNVTEICFTYRGELALQDVLEKLRDDLPSIQFRVNTARINPCHERGFPQRWDILGPYLQQRSQALN